MPPSPRPALILVLLAVSAVTACGSGSTSGSGAPAGSPASAAPASASASAADNGVAALSAEEIVGKAKAALAAADAVRIKGTAEDVDGRIAVDMRYGAGDAIGTFSIGGLELNLSRVGGAVYLKADTPFWTEYGDAELAKLVAGRYLKVDPDDERFVDLSDFTDLKRSAYDFLDLSGPLSKGDRRTTGPTPTIEVTDTSDEGGTLSVATTGEPYPLSIRSASDEVTFTGYGTDVTVPTPPAAQVLDADTLPEG